MLFLITLIMAMTAGVIIFSTHSHVGQAILEAEESSAQNVSQLIELKIRSGYNRLIADKIEILTRLQRELKHISTVGASIIEKLIELTESQSLTKEQAQETALSWLKSIDFDQGELFAVGRDAIVLGHSDQKIEGTSIADLRDLKGRSLANIINDENLSSEGDSAVFSWAGEQQSRGDKKMGYFIPINGWQWTIGAIVDFDDIEAESHKRMDVIIEELADTFNKIRIANTGYAFLFTGSKEVLIPPSGQNAKHFEKVINHQTNRPLLEDLIAATKSGEKIIFFSDPISTNNANNIIEAHLTYFKAFDWYVVLPYQCMRSRPLPKHW